MRKWFAFFLLCLVVPGAGWAKPNSGVNADFAFDLDALLTAGKTGSIPELVWVLRRDHDLEVLEVPRYRNPRFAYS